MRLLRIRVRKEYRLKVWSFLIALFIIGFILIPKGNRSMLITFFNVNCRNYLQDNYSKKLTDRIADYSAQSKANGIEPCKDKKDIQNLIFKRKLLKVSSNARFKIADMDNSYPYVTRDSKILLNEIGKRFQNKIKDYGLKGSRFIVTSMTRTTESMTGLKKTNGNVSDNSPHLNGNAFDISYAGFSFIKLHVTTCDEWYLKEALAEVIWQLRAEKKCWATYERNQGCFHIVAR